MTTLRAIVVLHRLQCCGKEQLSWIVLAELYHTVFFNNPEFLYIMLVHLMFLIFILVIVIFSADVTVAIDIHNIHSVSVLCIYCSCNNITFPLAGLLKCILFHSILFYRNTRTPSVRLQALKY